MKPIAAWLIIPAIALVGCHRATSKAARSEKSVREKLAVEWFKMPPVPRINDQDTLIPVLRIGGAW